MSRRALLLAIVALASPLRGQGARRIDVEVRMVAGGVVYLDRGREAGLEPGDAVILEPPGSPAVETKLDVVSRGSARATLPGGTRLAPGTRGHVVVPAARGQGGEAPKPGATPPTPAHPPWTQPLGPQDPNAPLLAPVYGRRPEDRPLLFGGRLFGQALHTRDEGGGRSSRYVLLRTGAEAWVTNPFGLGGRLDFDGELTHRQVELADAPDSEDSRGRLDRLSYTWGETPADPLRVQVGRFVPVETPALGLLDGVESTLRLTPATRVSASLGLLPEPFPALTNDDDVAASLAVRHDFDETLWGGLAFQKTWHEGDADRDLLLADLDWQPSKSLSLRGSAWVDFYGGGDTVKSSGAELSELHLDGTWTHSEDGGIGLGFAHVRWPEIRRHEFTPLLSDAIRNDRVDRFDLWGWQDLSDTLRLDARADWWQDQARNGLGGELAIQATDLLRQGGSLRLAGFWRSGAYLEGPGLRLQDREVLGPVYATLAYEIARYELSDTDTDLLEQALWGSLDFDPWARTNVSLSFDWRFGDDPQALTLGIFVQTRFGK